MVNSEDGSEPRSEGSSGSRLEGTQYYSVRSNPESASDQRSAGSSESLVESMRTQYECGTLKTVRMGTPGSYLYFFDKLDANNGQVEIVVGEDLNTLERLVKELWRTDRMFPEEMCGIDTEPGVIVYQTAPEEIPAGCSPFALVYDCHGQVIQDAEVLFEMAEEDVDVAPSLLLHLEHFSLEGKFKKLKEIEEEYRYIYVDKRTLHDIPGYDVRLLNPPQPARVRTPETSSGGTPEPSPESVPEKKTEHSLWIRDIYLRTHRYLLMGDGMGDGMGDRKPYLFFEVKDALNSELKFPSREDRHDLQRLLNRFNEQTSTGWVMVYHLRPHLPPRGCSRFGLISGSSDWKCISELENLITLSEENVDEEPILKIRVQYGKMGKILNIDKSTTDEDARNIQEPLGIPSNHNWVSSRMLRTTRYLFFDANEFLNEDPQSEYYWLREALEKAEVWEYAKEGVLVLDVKPPKDWVPFIVADTCNGEPVKRLGDLVKISKETVAEDLRIVGHLKNDPFEITVDKGFYWDLKPYGSL